jgi:hypothetical protein
MVIQGTQTLVLPFGPSTGNGIYMIERSPLWLPNYPQFRYLKKLPPILILLTS